MRILWFTNTPAKASAEFGYKSFGGGWISALEEMVAAEKKHQLGICFFYAGSEYKKVEKDNVTYYGIPYQKKGFLGTLAARHKGLLNDNTTPYADEILNHFKPDLIHVFGTEQGYGKILINKFEKVIFHLQGLVEPYSGVFFPNGFNKRAILKNSSIKDVARGVTFYNNYLNLCSKAAREKEIVKSWKFFNGRTDYDHHYVKLLNPGAKYYHVEELLRADFFNHHWDAPSEPLKSKTIVIGTTINPNIYKGLDLIYKTVKLLKNYNITWKIFGINEDRDVNRIVKKIMGIRQPDPAIKFYGPLDAGTLIGELKSCHFFVHPSYIDNSPNSVCEAMLLGMPILSSSVGGVNSLITHKASGYLFNPYDAYELAGLLIHLCNNYNDALRAASNAKTIARERHAPQNILESLNTMYTSVYNS